MSVLPPPLPAETTVSYRKRKARVCGDHLSLNASGLIATFRKAVLKRIIAASVGAMVAVVG